MASSSPVNGAIQPHASRKNREYTPNRESEKKSVLSFSKPAQFVTVFVGKAPNEEKFVVHKELICHHSPFFHAAFNGRFIEGQTQEMRVDDINEETFGQLVHWLYTQKIERCELPDLVLLGKLWILAERSLMPILQNHTIKQIHSLLQETIVAGEDSVKGLVQLVYGKEKEEHTMLRIFLVDLFASAPSQRIDEWADELPPKLLVELAKALGKEKEKKGRTKSTKVKKVVEYYVEEPALRGVSASLPAVGRDSEESGDALPAPKKSRISGPIPAVTVTPSSPTPAATPSLIGSSSSSGTIIPGRRLWVAPRKRPAPR